MSSKRSDADPILPAAHPAVLPYRPAPAGAWRRLRESGWGGTLLSNLPVPLVIALLLLVEPVLSAEWFGRYNARIVMLIGFNIVLSVSLQLINGFSGQFSLGHAGFMMVGAYFAAYPAINYSRNLSDPAKSLLFFVSLGLVVGAAALVILGLFLLLRLSRRVRTWVPTVLLLAVAVWVVADLSAGSRHDEVPARFVWSRSAAFARQSFEWLMSHGAPLAERASALFPEALRRPASFLVLVVGGGCFAAGTGLVVGIPALRLRGDYLAIATLGMAEIIRILIQNSEPLGGALGLTSIPRYTDFPWLYGFAVVTVVVVWRVAYSAKGRAIMAVREDEIAAAACGIDTTHHKVLAFVTGAFFGGCAGALFSLHERSITPGYFGIARSIEIVVMVTLGGLGSISGAILAAVLLTLLPEMLRDPPSVWPWGVLIGLPVAAVMIAINRRQWLAIVLTLVITAVTWEAVRLTARALRIDLAELRMVIYALLLILMMLLRPQGLLGGRELWPRRWGAVRRPRGRDPVATEDRDDREVVPAP